MTALRKLAGQTAIYGLSIALILSGCAIEPEEALIGTWSTPSNEGKVGMAQINEKGGFRTWTEPRPAEGSNLGRAQYFIVGDSLGLVGELMDTMLYLMQLVDNDHLNLTGPDKNLSLTRTAP